MGFVEAVKTCFSKYVDFQGRARRSEFWWWVLFVIVAGIVLNLIPVVGLIFSLAVLLPNLAVTVRRLHDTDRTGWWVLVPYVPNLIGAAVFAGAGPGEVPGGPALILVGIGLVLTIVLLVFLASRGTQGPNRFGPDPLETDVPAGAGGFT